MISFNEILRKDTINSSQFLSFQIFGNMGNQLPEIGPGSPDDQFWM